MIFDYNIELTPFKSNDSFFYFFIKNKKTVTSQKLQQSLSDQ
jgi:hypothetical protein